MDRADNGAALRRAYPCPADRDRACPVPAHIRDNIQVHIRDSITEDSAPNTAPVRAVCGPHIPTSGPVPRQAHPATTGSRTRYFYSNPQYGGRTWPDGAAPPGGSIGYR